MFTTIGKINESFLPANYEADNLQKVTRLVKTREGGKISRLPSPWRETHERRPEKFPVHG